MMGTMPFILMIVQTHMAQTLTRQHDVVRNVAREALEERLEAVHGYNRTLFESGRETIGEAADPWPDSNESVSETDGTYRNQLNLPPDGIMAPSDIRDLASICLSATAPAAMRSTGERATCTAPACLSEARTRIPSYPLTPDWPTGLCST